MNKRRSSLNRRLWSLVRQHPGGEETMRDMVARIHQEDGTGQELAGTDDFTSTRNLTDKQFRRLIHLVARGVEGRPRRRNDLWGNVAFLVGSKSKKYVEHMAAELGWSEEGLARFIERQTKGKGVRTWDEAQAVIVPLERMLRERGYELMMAGGRKWWVPPKPEETVDAEAEAQAAGAEETDLD